VAILHGDDEIQIQGNGVGIVCVKNAQALDAVGEGHRWEGSGDATLFWGWSGTIYASGDSMTVCMAGGLIEFSASGTVWAYLRGHGRYEANGHGGFWNPTSEILDLGSIQRAHQRPDTTSFCLTNPT
jgi:hypothetical protein